MSVTSCWLLRVDYFVLVTSCWLLRVGYFVLVTSCWWVNVGDIVIGGDASQRRVIIGGDASQRRIIIGDDASQRRAKEMARGSQAYAKGLPYPRHNYCSIVLRYFFDSSSMIYRTTIEELSNNYRRTDMASPWETYAKYLRNTCHILARYGSTTFQRYGRLGWTWVVPQQ